VLAVLGDDRPHRLEQHGDRRLVVGSEDRAGRVAHAAVLDDRLDPAVGRCRVEVRAEDERRACSRGVQA